MNAYASHGKTYCWVCSKLIHGCRCPKCDEIKYDVCLPCRQELKDTYKEIKDERDTQ